MSPAYRTYPLAQAIEEAARIFGPEVTAAALLVAAVEAASFRSTTPSRSFRRKPWTTLAVIAFAALAGAVVFGGGRESRDDAALLSAPANAAPSSAASASAVEPRDSGRRLSSSRARTRHRGGRSAADHDHTRNRRAHRSIHLHAQGAAKGIARACLPR